MAEFRSSAREGSFSENQFSVPDEVSKIQTAATRRISGMNSAQAALQEQNRLFLQAQQNAQQVNQRNRNDIYGVQEREAAAFKRSSEFAYKKELEREQAKNKFKVDTLGLLTNFSKTAASVVGAINKMDQDNMLRATNEVQFKQGFTFEDLKNAQSIKDTINDSETQRTAVIEQYLAEGKSPEFINAFNEHLVKNGGYRNYIGNATILTDLGRTHASELSLIANDDTLSPDQKRLALDTKQAELRASIEIDGRIPSPKILEQAYNPYIKAALRSADTVINQQNAKLLQERNLLDRRNNYLNAAYEGGLYTPGNALDQAKNSPKSGIVREIVSTLLTDPNLTLAGADQMKTDLFTGPNGKLISLTTGGYSDELQLIDAWIDNKKNENLQAFERAEEVKRLTAERNEIERFQNSPQTMDDFRVFESNLDRELGLTRDRTIDNAIKNETKDERAKQLIIQQIEEDFENGVLTEARLMSYGPPSDVINTWVGRAQSTDKALKRVKDEGVYDVLRSRIEAIVRENDSFVTFQGELKGDQVQWFIDTTARKYTREFTKAAVLGSVDIEDFVGRARLDVEQVKTNPKTGRMYAYDKAMEKGQNSYAASLTKQMQLNRLQRDKKLPPFKVIEILGEDTLIQASQQLEQTGRSEILEGLGARFGKTPYEIQNLLADDSTFDKLEKIEAPQQYNDLVESLDPQEKFIFTSDLMTRDAKIRVLMPRMGQPYPVRSSFGDRSLNSFAPQVSSIVMEDDSGQPGMDIFFENKQFPAVLGGVVKEKGTQGDQTAGYGNYIIIESTDPATGDKVDVLYSHLESPSDLQVGRTVIPGMIVGKQGGTGSVRSADGTIASIDFLAPAPAGSTSMVPYPNYKQLREQIAQQLTQ